MALPPLPPLPIAVISLEAIPPTSPLAKPCLKANERRMLGRVVARSRGRHAVVTREGTDSALAFFS